MEIVQFGKHEFALGLQWSNLSTDKIEAEAVATSEERSLPYGLVVPSHASRGNSSQVGLTDDVLAKGKIAAASIIAMLDENVIHIEELNDGLYWICAAANHEVIGGYDKVVTHEVLLQELNEVYAFMANVLDSTVIRIPEEIAIETEVEVDEYRGFESIVLEIEKSKDKKILAKHQIGKLRKIPRSFYLLIAFVSISSIAGYALMNNEKKVVLPEEYNLVNTAPVTVESVATSKKEATQEELLEKAREEELAWLESDFESQDPVKINNSIVNFVGSIPHVIGGWEMKGIRYNRENPRLLEVAWSNLGNGTSLTLKRSLGNMAGSYQFDLQGKRAKSFHNVVSQSTRNYDNYRNIMEFIRSNDYTHDELMHDLQILQYRWEMSYHAVTPRPVKISGIKDAKLAVARQLQVDIKDFKISGSGILSLQTVNSLFEKSKTALIRRVEITNDNGIQWTVIGELYEN